MSMDRTETKDLANVHAIARRYAGECRDQLGVQLRAIRLFGSAARGDWGCESDIDVLVLLDHVSGPDTTWLIQRAFEIGVLENGIVLQPVIMTESSFAELRDRERLFAAEIDREGIDL
jgi:predicted nucleotidyltransferase